MWTAYGFHVRLRLFKSTGGDLDYVRIWAWWAVRSAKSDEAAAKKAEECYPYPALCYSMSKSAILLNEKIRIDDNFL
jgi:hypothetical protein